jgi:hypothetical protein
MWLERRGDILGTCMHLYLEQKTVSISCDPYQPVHPSTSSLKQVTLKLPVVCAILNVKGILKFFPLPLHSASFSLVLDRKVSDASTVEKEIIHKLLVNIPYREVQRTYCGFASEKKKVPVFGLL